MVNNLKVYKFVNMIFIPFLIFKKRRISSKFLKWDKVITKDGLVGYIDSPYIKSGKIKILSIYIYMDDEVFIEHWYKESDLEYFDKAVKIDRRIDSIFNYEK